MGCALSRMDAAKVRRSRDQSRAVVCFGAREAIIFPKRGSPRSESHSGYSCKWPSCRGSASLINGSSATLGDGLAKACQRSPSFYDDGASDGAAGLAGIKVRALVRGETASGTSVPARSADNGPGVHMASIAIVA